MNKNKRSVGTVLAQKLKTNKTKKTFLRISCVKWDYTFSVINKKKRIIVVTNSCLRITSGRPVVDVRL